MSDLRAALADAERSDYGDDWMQEHKGELVLIEGRVWDCNDDYCGCSEASVAAVFKNRRTMVKAYVKIALWVGSFFSDHEPGAEEELAAFRRSLHATDPEMEARIVWPPGS